MDYATLGNKQQIHNLMIPMRIEHEHIVWMILLLLN